MPTYLSFSLVVQVTVAEPNGRAETDLTELTRVLEDPYLAAACSGTKRSIITCTGAFNAEMTQQREDPHFAFRQGSWCLFAQADLLGGEPVDKLCALLLILEWPASATGGSSGNN